MTHPEVRGISVGMFIAALERDGFVLERSRGTHLRYRHQDGRQITVPFHRSGTTFKRKTLHSILRATGWTDADLHRLGLIMSPPEVHT